MEILNYAKFNNNGQVEVHQIIEDVAIEDKFITIDDTIDRDKAVWYYADKMTTAVVVDENSIDHYVKDIRFAASQHELILFDDDSTPLSDILDKLMLNVAI